MRSRTRSEGARRSGTTARGGAAATADVGESTELRVLFDVGHPGHVHLFRNAIRSLQGMGHRTMVTSRDKECTGDLLDAYGLDHRELSRMTGSGAGVAGEWAVRTARLLVTAHRFDPDVLVGVLNPAVAQVGRLLGRRTVIYDDSEASRLAGRLTHPFADVVCTPSGYSRSLGSKQVRYEGYHELAYLHPNRFDPTAVDLGRYGVDTTEPYSVLRFVSWDAHHDVARRGLSAAGKRRLVTDLAERGPVYISSEGPLPSDLCEHRLPVPPVALHHLLAHARLYVGDSGTVSTEAALLGTPAIRVGSHAGGDDDMSNFTELERRYGLLHSTADEAEALETARQFVDSDRVAKAWRRRRTKLLAEKIDVTAHMTELILDEGGADVR